MASHTVPFRLGPYEAIAELGVGGMAAVYLARRAGTGGFERLVALKVLHRHQDPTVAARFAAEARIAASLHHPNVCSPFDFGHEGGVAYLAMEWLLGEPLSVVLEALRAARPDELPCSAQALVCTIVADACDGVHAAHEQTDSDGTPLRIVHRDLSPSNIVVTHDGYVKVIDFGIANDARSSRHTAPSEVVGKLAYMSPEQLRAEPLDRRSDVWSLGVVLWEGLAGRSLFGTESLAALTHRVLTDPIAPPSAHDAGVRASLDRLVLRTLQRDRETRCASARALATSLRSELRDHGELLLPGDVAQAMEVLFPGGRESRAALARGTASAEPTPRAPSGGQAAAPPLAVDSGRKTMLAWALVATFALALGFVAGGRGEWGDDDATARAAVTTPRPELGSAPRVSEPTASLTVEPAPRPPAVSAEEDRETPSPAQPASTVPEAAGSVARTGQTRPEPRPPRLPTREPERVAVVSPAATAEAPPSARGALRVILQGACHGTYFAAAQPERSQVAGRVLSDLPAGEVAIVVRVGETDLRRDAAVAAGETAILTVPCP